MSWGLEIDGVQHQRTENVVLHKEIPIRVVGSSKNKDTFEFHTPHQGGWSRHRRTMEKNHGAWTDDKGNVWTK
tara:strand:+ start:205 stop:423 length:219 start_codon:yes stop_codon:yes gene_type:complete